MESSKGVMPVIDIHRHCLASDFFSQTSASGLGTPSIRFVSSATGASALAATFNGVTSLLYTEVMDIDRQIQVQDEAGVTKGVLSFAMLLELLSLSEHASALEVAKRLNDSMASLVARYPTRLACMVMVNPFEESGIDECERCFREHGAKGISITSSWAGAFLDSVQLNPFWEYAEEQDAAIFIHPPLLPIGSGQMNRYKLEEVVGRPFDTTMTIARMIYSGVFDRYPRLKVVLAHMGGGLPSVLGRLDFGYRLGYEGLPEGEAAICERKPSEYLRTNLYVDTMGFSPTGIEQSIELFGVDRVLLGSDYPAVPISPREHIDLVKSLGLSQEDEARILWKTANELFKLAVTE